MWQLWVAVAVGAVVVAILAALTRSTSPPLPTQHKRWTPSRVVTQKTGRRYLVIGGHGFLGSHIVEALLARGEKDIWVFDAAPSSLFEEERKVKFIRGDILNKDHLLNACYGRDVVFHTAALLNYWSRLSHDYEKIHKINYVGTKNVIEACRTAGVKKLLYTSTASMFVTAETLKKPIRNQSEETLMYPEEPVCHYTRTKMLAEKLVLASNGYSGVMTAAIRPNGIYGPRDAMIGGIVSTGAPGIGFMDNKQDYVYVENLVHGFLKLEEHLLPGSAAAGKAYFITDDEPLSYYEFNSKFSAHFGKTFKILPRALSVFLAYAVETISRLTKGRLSLGQLQILTPATLVFAGAEYYFSTERAKKELDWRPLYTVEEGMKNTADYFKALHEENRIKEGKKEK
jgi:sterol-4alpha-carboxylate 3-dehydrogenase (decarboxylating)